MIAAVLLASEAPQPNNGHQMELLTPGYLLESALKPYLQVSLDLIVVVLGHDYHVVLNRMKDVPEHVKFVIHRKPERGIASALSVGLRSLALELYGIVIARGDQVVDPKVVEQLLGAFHQERQKSSGKSIVVPMYQGKRGYPWIVANDFRKSLTQLEGDLTLGAFLKTHKKEVLNIPIDTVLN